MTSFYLSRAFTRRAAHFGLDFVLSMIKRRGYAGFGEFWTHDRDPRRSGSMAA